MIYHNIREISKPYELVLADPPWEQTRGGKKNRRPNSTGKGLDYPTMTSEDIEEHLRTVRDISAENSVLFLWTIEKYLVDSSLMLQDLGYRIHDRIVWSKCGMGQAPAFTVRYSHEYLIYAYKGKFTPVALEARGKFADVIEAKPRKHSQKPEEAYLLIESLYPDLSKLEMYARNTRSGWDSFGNEI